MKETAYVLTFEKQGYKPVEVSLKRAVDGWIFGNIVFGGLIGLVIDLASGSAYKLTPQEVKAVLDKSDVVSKNIKEGDLLVFVDLERLPQEIRTRIAKEEDRRA